MAILIFLIRSFPSALELGIEQGGGRCTQHSTRIIPAAWTADYSLSLSLVLFVPLYIMDLGQLPRRMDRDQRPIIVILIGYCLYLPIHPAVFLRHT